MAVLVKTSFDYADEFDCREFAVFNDEDYERWIAAWERKLKAGMVEVYFGTNEELQIDSFDQFESGLEVIVISDLERKAFDRCFDGAWGTGNIFSFNDFDDEYFEQESGDDLPPHDLGDEDEFFDAC